jgi:hypothetical protein
MPINSANNLIGQAPYTRTLSALFDAITPTDVLTVDDTGLELLSQIINLPNGIVTLFIQNTSAETVGVFVGESDTGFDSGVLVAENNGITIEPLGNNVYLKTAANTADVVVIIQYSIVAFPPVL